MYIWIIRICIRIFLITTFLLQFKTTVLAGDISINEFLVEPDSLQWVELYNKGENQIDISGWFIDDNGGTQKYTISQGTNINPKEYKIFESSLFNLNSSSSDKIYLLSGETIEDSFEYATGPGLNSSYGREADYGAWVVFQTPTKGSSNNNSSPVPTATLTPTKTPTPTVEPTATKTPTPTRTPTPTLQATPTKVPTPTKIPTPTKLPTSIIKSTEPTEESKKVLGEFTKKSNTSSQASDNHKIADLEVTETFDKEKDNKEKITPKAVVLSTKSKSLSVFFIGVGGILLMGCGILLAYRYREQIFH